MKTFPEATKIKQSVEDNLLKIPGVTGIDVGYRVIHGKQTDQPVIRIYVKTIQNMQSEVAHLKEIQGVQVELIERNFELH